MNKYCLIIITIPFLHTMDRPNDIFEEALTRLTPLQKAVIEDDYYTVKNILEPATSQESRVARLRRTVTQLVHKAHSSEQLCDEITKTCYSFGGNLLHINSGKLTFRVLKPRYIHPIVGNEIDPRNFQEVGLYNPTNKAQIMKLLLKQLWRGTATENFGDRLKKVINEPDENGYTALHLAIISALAFTKNGYNAFSNHDLERHTDTIKALISHGADWNVRLGTIPPAHTFAIPCADNYPPKPRIVTTFRWFKSPLGIMRFFRDSHSPKTIVPDDFENEVDQQVFHKVTGACREAMQHQTYRLLAKEEITFADVD